MTRPPAAPPSWTPEDEAAMMDCVAMGRTPAEAASLMGRAYDTVLLHWPPPAPARYPDPAAIGTGPGYRSWWGQTHPGRE